MSAKTAGQLAADVRASFGDWRFYTPESDTALAELVSRLQAAEAERDALAEAQQFPVETVMSWKRRAESAETSAAAAEARVAALTTALKEIEALRYSPPSTLCGIARRALADTA